MSEQLIQLEQQPQDKALVNAIFRGFHTIKGGAGFLQLNTLVDYCHIIENLFDNLRQGHCAVTSELIDVALKADAVKIMFEQLQQGQSQAADPTLLANLSKRFNHKNTASAITSEVDIADAEFEQFLRAITGTSQPQEVATQPACITANNDNDEITDDEFEALLNDLHGTRCPGSAKAMLFSGIMNRRQISLALAKLLMITSSKHCWINHGKGRGPTTAARSELASANLPMILSIPLPKNILHCQTSIGCQSWHHRCGDHR